MSDDLIAGAKWTLENAAGMTLENEEVGQICDMADRIEELELEIEIWKSRAIHQNEVAGKLEAKLAKAVEALRFYAEGEWPEDYPGGVLFAAGDDTPEFKTHIDYGDKARNTLAELTGGQG